ncbi:MULTISPECIES: hypothetical protein [unclassified Corallococcus]|uniref:hypothetical protein n=1 Tax=unclassified Corallococcus TaxID=2685029 RepID=UPI001A8E9CE1|nr:MULTISPECIES: hypothetical protein [unclassified Corallococcus]MBN9681367.1 hypothetical protein [Corallococcus sp. NCSPR001]WAS87052.1 hypothetical protein O0N60_08750 [Corallococcus sp. NCRR]
MAWTAPTLGLLLFAGPALASEPTVSKGGDQSGNQPSTNIESASTSRSNVVNTVPSTSPVTISPGQSVRQITPDPDKVRQVNGPVVKRSGMMLYVKDVTGPVVPLDMSALTILKQPEKGQHVQALYQVDNTDNVALSLQGEKQD